MQNTLYKDLPSDLMIGPTVSFQKREAPTTYSPLKTGRETCILIIQGIQTNSDNQVIVYFVYMNMYKCNCFSNGSNRRNQKHNIHAFKLRNKTLHFQHTKNMIYFHMKNKRQYLYNIILQLN